MAEETINEVIERVQARVDNSQHAVGTAMIDTADAMALVEEIEQLRLALGMVLRIVASDPNGGGSLYQIKQKVNAALNAQSAAPINESEKD